MKKIIFQERDEKGSVTAIALMILVVLTLLGLHISKTASIDTQIAGNEIPYKQNFYVSEGGVNRESEEVGRGNYPVTDIYVRTFLANETGLDDGDNVDEPAEQGVGTLPGGTAHTVGTAGYDFSLWYEGFFLPPKGYSVIHFSRYDYTVDADSGPVRVASRYYKIGPKAE